MDNQIAAGGNLQQAIGIRYQYILPAQTMHAIVQTGTDRRVYCGRTHQEQNRHGVQSAAGKQIAQHCSGQGCQTDSALVRCFRLMDIVQSNARLLTGKSFLQQPQFQTALSHYMSRLDPTSGWAGA